MFLETLRLVLRVSRAIDASPYFFLPAMAFAGPLRVRAFVCVRWPRTGQIPAMPQAPVAAKIHQALDVHLRVAAQITLDGKVPVDVLANFQDFRITQLVYTATMQSIPTASQICCADELPMPVM